MKKSILVLPAFLFLFSCGGNGEQTEDVTENATWEIVKAEGTLAEMNKGTEYIFEGENLTLSGGGMKNKGTYKMKGDTLVFTMESFGGGEMRYLKEMKGEQMVLKVVGSDQVFYLDKK